ncbi:LysE family translocator [Methanolobus sp. WCC5]|jgi:threonine/homoserine/homoserine lactone efflux protein|uniref:LysE family translocator n=1 Tax=Methanolobus sp. WCC5 TaxID=3125785 RepID=UPI003248C597
MPGIIEFLLSGIFLGLAAGISPGPLLALTVSQTLQHGPGEGIKVALSPLLTDFFIVSSVLLVLVNFESQGFALAIISLAGAAYLIHLGIGSFRIKNDDIDLRTGDRNSLRKGILANFLSPHPYLFWITIGAPILFSAIETDMRAAGLFIAGFYTLLVGSKVLVAIIVGRSRSFLSSGYYLCTIRAMGLVYIVFALFFIGEGMELLASDL